jgi:hypothetical protein
MMVLIAIEGIAQLFYFGAQGVPYSRADLTRIAAGEGPAEGTQFELAGIAQRRILHPYLGYVMDRRETMGVSGDSHPVQKRAAGKYLVAVTGGSVANQIRRALGDALRAEFDVVINIDGFNDIVLPIVDNYERSIYPFYPRAWKSFVNRRPSQQTLLRAGEISHLRQTEVAVIHFARSKALGRSAVFGLYAAREIARSSARISELQRELLAETIELPFEASGPYQAYDDVAEVFAEAAKVWARSSILMHHVLAGVGAEYIHVLQPNQYVEGSKVLTESELVAAYDLDHPYASSAGEVIRTCSTHLRGSSIRASTTSTPPGSSST